MCRSIYIIKKLCVLCIRLRVHNQPAYYVLLYEINFQNCFAETPQFTIMRTNPYDKTREYKYGDFVR